jgi:TRAP-type C4-dicarboxylate transport system permease small subunit
MDAAHAISDAGPEHAPGGTGPAAIRLLDKLFGATIEGVAALLVALEICLLSAGVIARYLLHSPITWNDELASILFLWLSMLGAVIATRRGAHIRMTSLITHAAGRTRDRLDILAAVACMALAAVLLHAGWEYAADEAMVTTPALGISSAWRAAAIPGPRASHACRIMQLSRRRLRASLDRRGMRAVARSMAAPC